MKKSYDAGANANASSYSFSCRASDQWKIKIFIEHVAFERGNRDQLSALASAQNSAFSRDAWEIWRALRVATHRGSFFLSPHFFFFLVILCFFFFSFLFHLSHRGSPGSIRFGYHSAASIRAGCICQVRMAAGSASGIEAPWLSGSAE